MKQPITPLVHEIRIRNQVIYLEPPIEIARQEWLYQFQDVLGRSLAQRSGDTSSLCQASCAT